MREILVLVEAEIATVQLLRQLFEHLERHDGLRWRMVALGELEDDDIRAGAFPLIVRSCNPDAGAVVKGFRKAGIQYGYYIDDNFWKLDGGTELGKHYAEPGTRRRLETIVAGAHPVIAATEPLLGFLAAYSDDVLQLDSFYDFRGVPSMLPAPPDREIVRGGFAASVHRGDDLEQIMPAVRAALAAHDNLEFEIIGPEMADLPADSRIRWFPYQGSYEAYTRFQQERRWDFGLAPLGAAESNLYKTDNKYREYAAQGIAGIYTESPPYRFVQDGVTGLLAGGSRSWAEAIELYCTDRELRWAVRENARRDAETRFALGNVAPAWNRVLTAAPGMSEESREAFVRRLRRRRRVMRPIWRTRAFFHAIGQEFRDNGPAGVARRSVRFVSKRVPRGR